MIKKERAKKERKMLQKAYENRKDNSLLRMFLITRKIEAQRPVSTHANLEEALDFELLPEQKQNSLPKFYSM